LSTFQKSRAKQKSKCLAPPFLKVEKGGKGCAKSLDFWVLPFSKR
jgi:hypothetical protein